MNNSQKNKTYLDVVQLKKGFENSWPAKYLKNTRLMVLFLFAVILIGVTSYVSMSRTLFPQIEIPIIIVTTPFPGASPSEVEELVTIPLENAIKRVNSIDSYQSTSQDSISIITVQFTSDKDVKEARDEVQTAVDTVNDLPDDVLDSSVSDIDFENTPIWTFALTKTNDDQDILSLMQQAENLKQILEDLSLVDRIELSGFDQREISIKVKPQIIKDLEVSPNELSQIISTSLMSYPAGNVVTQKGSYAITIDKPVKTIDQLRKLNINLNKKDYQLSDLAIIAQNSKPNQTLSYLAKKQENVFPAVTFSIYKTKNADINQAYDQVHEAIEQELQMKQGLFTVRSLYDYVEMIDMQFQGLFDNFFQTLILVFFSMFLLYGIRQAFIASLSVPFSLLIIFSVMRLTGIDLSMISVFSLLIALGLFVDNAVVVIEGFTAYYKSGRYGPWKTAVLVWQDYALELFSINLLTIWAFLPLLITSGIIGEFIKPIPILVSTAMLASVVIALLFTLPSMMLLVNLKIPLRVRIFLLFILIVLGGIVIINLIPPSLLFLPTLFVIFIALIYLFRIRKKVSKSMNNYFEKYISIGKYKKYFSKFMDQGVISLENLSKKYEIVILKLLNNKSLRFRVFIAVIVLTIASYFLVPLGFVEGIFFPKSDFNYIEVQLELPEGTNVNKTQEQAIPILEQISAIEEVKFVSLQLQTGSNTGFSLSGSKTNLASFTLVLEDAEDRDRTSMEISNQIRQDFNSYDQGKIQVIESSYGPPAGEDLNISILGKDLDKLQLFADEIIEYLNNIEGTTNVQKSISAGTSKLVFQPDKNKLKYYGLSEATIGMWMRTWVSGFKLDEITLPDEKNKKDIFFRVSDKLLNPESLLSLTISTRNYGQISVSELGKFVMQSNPTVINRLDGNRVITVTAASLPGFSATQLNESLQQFVANDLNLEPGYSWQVGGVNEENRKSIESIISAMGISALLILVTMVLQLGSFRKSFIVMIVIPLAMSGVFLIFALTGIPLSFPAMVGLLSLFGIVIANSLMIVDKINKNIEVGFELKKAIAEAGSSRLEPIALTSGSQIIGLIPITISDPLWQGMGGAIIAGLTFSGLIMLLFIPIMYYYLYQDYDDKLLSFRKLLRDRIK